MEYYAYFIFASFLLLAFRTHYGRQNLQRGRTDLPSKRPQLISSTVQSFQDREGRVAKILHFVYLTETSWQFKAENFQAHKVQLFAWKLTRS